MAEVETEEKAATAELETQRPENVLTLLTVRSDGTGDWLQSDSFG